jgi:23S rRNA (uracil1939-C5)-methyltransferase
MVRSTLERQGKITAPNGISYFESTGSEWHTRHRVDLHLNRSGQLGFYRRGSGDLVAIDNCLLVTPEINQAIAKIRIITNKLAPSIGGVRIENEKSPATILLKQRENQQTSSQIIKEIVADLAPFKVISEASGEIDESETTGSFSQVSLEGNLALQRCITSLMDQSDTSITELYAGAGNLTIPIANKAAQVFAIEVVPQLVRSGRARINEAGLSNKVKFIEQSSERYIKKHPATTTLLLDPPRSGAKEIAQAIKSGAWGQELHKIIYVSCSLPTLTRDLQAITAAGFKLQQIFLIDMFPQTFHVESIVELRRG